MFSIYTIIFTFIVYMGVLFAIAYTVDNKNILKSKALTPYIYSLSFAIYCTAWTYYGSVGNAVSSGYLFLTVYLGPTLVMFLWPVILRKMVRIKNIFKITSLADLISVRYDKSRLIGAVVSLGALFGTIPYISIQLKALITSIEILQDKTLPTSFVGDTLSNNVGILIVILMIFFTIIFGIRKLDPTERHEGMMTIVAIESLVKLFAIMLIGFFIIFVVMDGVQDILLQADKQKFFKSLAIEEGGAGYANWVSVLILSMFAIMFLPRQFHVSVVENSNEKHISTVMWVFPLYLLLITFFTIPIAMGGNLLSPHAQSADFYVLSVPMQMESEFYSMIAFIGGFSASTSMIMITSMTMAIMISNYLLLPLIEVYQPLAFLKKRILFLRWCIVTVFISLGYIFYLFISKNDFIVNIGLISFTAILQFAPIIIGGLFWKSANKSGALWGLSFGFLIWFYTLILPQLVDIGLISSNMLEYGLFGIWLLKPTALLGLSEFASIPHAVFWSMMFNISAFVIFSLSSKNSDINIQAIDDFINALDNKEDFNNYDIRNNINLKEKCILFENVLNDYFTSHKTKNEINKLVEDLNYNDKDFINILEYSKLYSGIERILTGSIGTAGAHRTLSISGLFTSDESKELSNVYASMLSNMNITPFEFNKKINYFQERENLLQEHSEELTKKIKERDLEIEARKKAEQEIMILNENLELKVHKRTNELQKSNEELNSSMKQLKEAQEHLIESETMASLGSLVAGVAHEINTPVGLSLTGITHFLYMTEEIKHDYENENLSEESFKQYLDDSHLLAKSININLKKTADLVRSFKQVAVDQSSESKRVFNINDYIHEVLLSINNVVRKTKIKISVECDKSLTIESYPGAFSQIITNLIMNSLEHAYDDGSEGNIVIKFYKAEEENEFMLLFIDDGKGMNEKNKSKIFEPFFTTNREHGGSGLGMNIIYNLVNTKLSGNIICESKEGEGTKFIITIHV